MHTYTHFFIASINCNSRNLCQRKIHSVTAAITRMTVNRFSTTRRDFTRDFTRNRNRKLLISRAPTKVKSQEPAYSQALNQNKIDRQRSRSRESGRQTVRRLWWMVFGVETGRGSWG